MTTQELIDRKTSAISSLDIEIAKLETSRLAWANAVSKHDCSKGTKKRKAGCKTSLANDQARVRTITAAQTSARTKRATFVSDISALKKQQITENQVAVLLAENGTSVSAELERAKGDSEVEKIKANAEAEAIKIDAENIARINVEATKNQLVEVSKENEEKAKNKNLFIIGGIVLFVIIVVFAYIKLKSE